MNRREFLVGGAMLVGGQAIAAPVKSILGAKVIDEDKEASGNPYQTSDNALIKHYDAEWNDGLGIHSDTDYWRNLAVEDSELESINNGGSDNPFKMRDAFIEVVDTKRWAGFKMFEAGQSPSAFTAIYAVSDNTGYFNASPGHNFVFGKTDIASIFVVRIGNWTYNLNFSNAAVSKVTSMAFFVAENSFGIFNPQTLKWTTKTKAAYNLPLWGIGNLYNQGAFPSRGAKFYDICVYNRILSERELAKVDAVNVKRFGPDKTIGFAL